MITIVLAFYKKRVIVIANIRLLLGKNKTIKTIKIYNFIFQNLKFLQYKKIVQLNNFKFITINFHSIQFKQNKFFENFNAQASSLQTRFSLESIRLVIDYQV